VPLNAVYSSNSMIRLGSDWRCATRCGAVLLVSSCPRPCVGQRRTWV